MYVCVHASRGSSLLFVIVLDLAFASRYCLLLDPFLPCIRMFQLGAEKSAHAGIDPHSRHSRFGVWTVGTRERERALMT